MELRDRLLEVIKERFESQKRFAEGIGVTRQSVHSVLKNGSPGLDFLIRLHEKVPDLNLNWLLFGEGKKYLGAEEQKYDMVGEPGSGYGYGDGKLLGLLRENIAVMQRQITQLQEALIEKSRQKSADEAE